MANKMDCRKYFQIAKATPFLQRYLVHLQQIEQDACLRFRNLLPLLISTKKNHWNFEHNHPAVKHLLLFEEYEKLLIVCRNNRILKKRRDVLLPTKYISYIQVKIGILLTLLHHLLKLIYVEQEISYLTPVLIACNMQTPLLDSSRKKKFSIKFLNFIKNICTTIGYRVVMQQGAVNDK